MTSLAHDYRYHPARNGGEVPHDATVFLLCLARLWYGAHNHRSTPIWIAFAICALPSLSLVGRGIYPLVRWFKHSESKTPLALIPEWAVPLLGLLSQTRAVTVGNHGLTHVELDFDTGIR